MNMISTGAFLPETDASTKQSELVKKLTAAWEKKNSKTARAGGASLMALSLAACGGEDNTPFSAADVSAAETAAAAAATTAALTGADGTVYASVDAAVTSNDTAIADAATAAVDITTDNQAAIDAAVAAVDLTTDNAAAIDAAVAADTAFASLADLVAAYDSLAAPAGTSLALTSSVDVMTAGDGDDTISGTSGTYAAADIITDTGGTDTLNLSLTGNAAAATVVGIENINMNFTTFAEPTADLTNVKNGTVTVTQSQAGGSTAATVSGAGNLTVTAGSGVSGTFTITQADGSNLTIDAGTAATVTHSEVADTLASTVTVNGSAASTSITVDGGDQGTVVVNGTTTDRQITTTGKDITVNSAYVGTSTSVTTDSEIAYTGENNVDDVASITMAGVVSLAASAATETATFTGSQAVTATVTGGLGTTTDLAGENDIGLVGAKAVLNAEKITSSGTGSYSVRVTDDIAGAFDASKFDSDISVRLDVIGTGDTITIDSGATVDYRDATGTDVLELISSATAGTTGESLTIVANAAATLITNGDAGDGTGADRFETVNVTSSTVATTVTALLGDAAMTLGGSKAITTAATSTAASVTNNGVTANYTIDGTNDFATITGSATSTDTIIISETAGDDLSDNTISNIDVIDMTKAAVNQTLVLDASQVNGKTIAIDGTLNGAVKDAVTIDANSTTVDLSGVTVNATNVGTVTINLTGVAGAATNITGTGGVDALSNQGAGAITFDGAGGADTLTGGSGNDVLTGGNGGDGLTGAGGNDTYHLAETTAAQDTVNFDYAAGEKDTVTGFTAGSASTADIFSIDFSDITGIVTEIANLDDGVTTAVGDAIVIQTITAGTSFDLGTATANSNVIAFDGNFASSSALATAVNSGGDTALKFGGAFTAGDAMLALYDNGTATTLAYISSATGVADDAISTDLTVTDLAVFSDIGDATEILAGNLAFA
jgi:hypothetical protein